MGDMLYPSHPATIADRDGFRAARQDGLYSTDTPAILGLSKWGSPLSVYLSKVEPTEAEGPMSLQAYLGHRLEDTLAQLWMERNPDTPVVRVPEDEPLFLTGEPWLRTHLDFRSPGGLILVECKTRSRRTDDWGPDGSPKVPVDIWVQVQHELMVTGASRCDVAVLFGLYGFEVHPIERDERFMDAALTKLRTFWTDHVLARVPPELTGHAVDTEWSKRHPVTEPGLRSATPDVEDLMRRFQQARINVSQAELAEAELENRIREWIGEREGIQGTFGTVTYKRSKDGSKTDWELVADSYRKMLDELVELADPATDEDVERVARIQTTMPLVEGLYTRTVPGTRRLNVKFKAAEENGDGD